MALLFILAGLLIAVIVALYIFGFFTPEAKPPQPRSEWWGTGEKVTSADTVINQFKVSLP